MITFDRTECQGVEMIARSQPEADASGMIQEFIDDGGQTSNVISTEVSFQSSNGVIHRPILKSPIRVKWTDKENRRFHCLAGMKAKGKSFTRENRTEFLQLQDRRRRLLLKVSAAQEILDRQDRELRKRARAALEAYFEFLRSKG
jgi:hypothetical protein